MQVYYFTELPYHEYSDAEGAKYPSLRLTFPNTHYDPTIAHGLFHRYLDEYQYCEEMGFDGLMINEHHSTPSCMNATMNLIGAILARFETRHSIDPIRCRSGTNCTGANRLSKKPTGLRMRWRPWCGCAGSRICMIRVSRLCCRV